MIVFVACGKEKVPGKAPVPAGHLYCGSFFRTAFRLALQIAGENPVKILSAKHGVLDPYSTWIEPYNVKLSDLSKGALAGWRNSVRFYVESEIQDGRHPIYVCGAFYRKGLPGVSAIPEGLPMGRQMQYMKELSKRLHRFENSLV